MGAASRPSEVKPVNRKQRDERLVTIATFDTQMEASLARGALETVGIPALVPGEASGSFTGLYSGGPASSSELKVFESDGDRAMVELRRLQIRIVPNEPER
jgi:hypothetical protein